MISSSELIFLTFPPIVGATLYSFPLPHMPSDSALFNNNKNKAQRI